MQWVKEFHEKEKQRLLREHAKNVLNSTFNGSHDAFIDSIQTFQTLQPDATDEIRDTIYSMSTMDPSSLEIAEQPDIEMMADIVTMRMARELIRRK